VICERLCVCFFCFCFFCLWVSRSSFSRLSLPYFILWNKEAHLAGSPATPLTPGVLATLLGGPPSAPYSSSLEAGGPVDAGAASAAHQASLAFTGSIKQEEDSDERWVDEMWPSCPLSERFSHFLNFLFHPRVHTHTHTLSLSLPLSLSLSLVPAAAPFDSVFSRLLSGLARGKVEL
jgi:hypothetical protein